MDMLARAGTVHPDDPASITWGALPRHPGPLVQRAASGTVGALAVFVGGADRPYDLDGIGFDGKPAEPRRQVVSYLPRVSDKEWYAAVDHLLRVR